MKNLLRGLMLVLIMLVSKSLRADDDKPQPFANSVLLVLLDSSEVDIGGITSSAVTALDQQAAPLVISLATLRTIFTLPTLDEVINKQPDAERALYGDVKKYYDAIDAVLQNLNDAEDYSKLGPKYRMISLLNKPDDASNFKSSTALQDIDSIRKGFSLSLLNIDRVIRNALIKRFIAFRQEDWLVRRIDADLALLVPQLYIQKIKQQGIKAQAKGFSEQEALLGLQVDHLEAIPNIVETAKNYKNSSGYFAFIPALSKIFVPRTAYAPEKTETGSKQNLSLGSYFVPDWAIFMSGHGQLGSAIVGLSLEQFKQLLDFLETKINTKLFAYLSCYAAGVNSIVIYKDLKANLFKTYSFAIATGALTDAPTSTLMPLLPINIFEKNDIDFKNKKLRVRHYLDFTDFVSQVMTADIVDYTKLLSPVFKDAQGLLDYFELSKENKTNFKRIGKVENVPQLKLPGIPWFSVVDANQKTVSIGKVMAISRTADLNIIDYFKTNPLGILLYYNDIPFVINLRGVNDEVRFVSMFPSINYFIKGIKVDFDLKAFLKIFQVFEEYPAEYGMVDVTKFMNLMPIFNGYPNNIVVGIESLWLSMVSAKPQEIKNVVLRFHHVGERGVTTMYKLAVIGDNQLLQQWNPATSSWGLIDGGEEEVMLSLVKPLLKKMKSNDRATPKLSTETQQLSIREAQEKKISSKSPEAFEKQMKQDLEEKKQVAQQLTLLEQSLMSLSKQLDIA